MACCLGGKAPREFFDEVLLFRAVQNGSLDSVRNSLASSTKPLDDVRDGVSV